MSLDLMRLALIADFDSAFPPHVATEAAVSHTAAALGISAEPGWMRTAELADHAAAKLARFAGVWIAPGSPYQSISGVLAAIRFARESDLPLLGTCGGFQHMVIEYARNVLGIEDAEHEEYLASAEHPHPNPLPKREGAKSRLFISQLACSLVGKTMQVRLKPGSRSAEAYGALTAEEQYYCNFGINPEAVATLFGADARSDPRSACGSAGASPSPDASKHLPALRQAPAASRTLTISGTDQDGEPRVIELPDHPFFVATLYVPQLRSRPGKPHPLVMAWLTSARRTDL